MSKKRNDLASWANEAAFGTAGVKRTWRQIQQVGLVDPLPYDLLDYESISHQALARMGQVGRRPGLPKLRLKKLRLKKR